MAKALALVKLENEKIYNSLGEEKEILHVYKAPGGGRIKEGDVVLVEGNGVHLERGTVEYIEDNMSEKSYNMILQINRHPIKKIVSKYIVDRIKYDDEVENG